MPAKEFLPVVALGAGCPGEPSRDLRGLSSDTLTPFLVSARQFLASLAHILVDDGEPSDAWSETRPLNFWCSGLLRIPSWRCGGECGAVPIGVDGRTLRGSPGEWRTCSLTTSGPPRLVGGGVRGFG